MQTCIVYYNSITSNGWIELNAKCVIQKRNTALKYDTYGKNLNALTSKLFFVNASRMSSSVTVVLQCIQERKKNVNNFLS